MEAIKIKIVNGIRQGKKVRRDTGNTGADHSINLGHFYCQAKYFSCTIRDPVPEMMIKKIY
jgi:hypothetical protein